MCVLTTFILILSHTSDPCNRFHFNPDVYYEISDISHCSNEKPTIYWIDLDVLINSFMYQYELPTVCSASCCTLGLQCWRKCFGELSISPISLIKEDISIMIFQEKHQYKSFFFKEEGKLQLSSAYTVELSNLVMF